MTPQLAAILFGFGTCASTGIGGILALKFKDRLGILLGFSAGALVALSFFDLLPAALAHADNVEYVKLALALGFLSLFIPERLTITKQFSENKSKQARANSTELGSLGAAGLSLHSFLDGAAIGIGFNANASLGLAIALAVILHDMSDGLNTVTVVLAHGKPTIKQCLTWLAIDMVAPLLGVASTIFLRLPPSILPLLLGFFSGFFLYMGASDLLPAARESKSRLIAASTIGGMLVVYIFSKLYPI